MWATVDKVRFFLPTEVLQPMLKLWLLQNESALFISLYFISSLLVVSFGGQNPLKVFGCNPASR
jgi:hypothetical protein